MAIHTNLVKVHKGVEAPISTVAKLNNYGDAYMHEP